MALVSYSGRPWWYNLPRYAGRVVRYAGPGALFAGALPVLSNLYSGIRATNQVVQAYQNTERALSQIGLPKGAINRVLAEAKNQVEKRVGEYRKKGISNRRSVVKSFRKNRPRDFYRLVGARRFKNRVVVGVKYPRYPKYYKYM